MLAIGSLGYLMLASGDGVLVVPGALIAFGAGWGWPGMFNFAVVHQHRSAPATATGFTQMGVYLGAALGPIMFGLLAEVYSFQLAWSCVAVVSLLAAGTMLLNAALAQQPSEIAG